MAVKRQIVKVDENPDENILEDAIKSTLKGKGVKRKLVSIIKGYDGDDFVQGLISLLISYKEYKKPRFIK